MTNHARLLGGVELGGSKVRCAVAVEPARIQAQTMIATASPRATLAQVRAFFDAHAIDALGIASFGPLQQDPARAHYGRILDTPKLDWRNVDLLTALAGLDVPVGLDTDVTAAALAEGRLGAGTDCGSLIYVTVGTGIGAGVLMNGKPLPGRAHPEVGHMWVRHDMASDPWPGCCPYHGDCLEGLASGPALAQRWGMAASELDAAHAAWPLQAGYLAQMCVNLTRVLAPERIILGGGVMQNSGLLAGVRRAFVEQMGGYHTLPAEEVETYLAAPQLGAISGLVGALILADEAVRAA